jgi:hypothetical protein
LQAFPLAFDIFPRWWALNIWRNLFGVIAGTLLSGHAKNRSDLALTKFEEANRYAPNWGRLHLKWGEALGYVGRKDEARAQYRIASTLDLSVADKAELPGDRRG